MISFKEYRQRLTAEATESAPAVNPIVANLQRAIAHEIDAAFSSIKGEIEKNTDPKRAGVFSGIRNWWWNLWYGNRNKASSDHPLHVNPEDRHTNYRKNLTPPLPEPASGTSTPPPTTEWLRPSVRTLHEWNKAIDKVEEALCRLNEADTFSHKDVMAIVNQHKDDLIHNLNQIIQTQLAGYTPPASGTPSSPTVPGSPAAPSSPSAPDSSLSSKPLPKPPGPPRRVPRVPGTPVVDPGTTGSTETLPPPPKDIPPSGPGHDPMKIDADGNDIPPGTPPADTAGGTAELGIPDAAKPGDTVVGDGGETVEAPTTSAPISSSSIIGRPRRPNNVPDSLSGKKLQYLQGKGKKAITLNGEPIGFLHHHLQDIYDKENDPTAGQKAVKTHLDHLVNHSPKKALVGLKELLHAYGWIPKGASVERRTQNSIPKLIDAVAYAVSHQAGDSPDIGRMKKQWKEWGWEENAPTEGTPTNAPPLPNQAADTAIPPKPEAGADTSTVIPTKTGDTIASPGGAVIPPKPEAGVGAIIPPKPTATKPAPKNVLAKDEAASQEYASLLSKIKRIDWPKVREDLLKRKQAGEDFPAEFRAIERKFTPELKPTTDSWVAAMSGKEGDPLATRLEHLKDYLNWMKIDPKNLDSLAGNTAGGSTSNPAGGPATPAPEKKEPVVTPGSSTTAPAKEPLVTPPADQSGPSGNATPPENTGIDDNVKFKNMIMAAGYGDHEADGIIAKMKETEGASFGDTMKALIEKSKTNPKEVQQHLFNVLDSLTTSKKGDVDASKPADAPATDGTTPVPENKPEEPEPSPADGSVVANDADSWSEKNDAILVKAAKIRRPGLTKPEDIKSNIVDNVFKAGLSPDQSNAVIKKLIDMIPAGKSQAEISVIARDPVKLKALAGDAAQGPVSAALEKSNAPVAGTTLADKVSPPGPEDKWIEQNPDSVKGIDAHAAKTIVGNVLKHGFEPEHAKKVIGNFVTNYASMDPANKPTTAELEKSLADPKVLMQHDDNKPDTTADAAPPVENKPTSPTESTPVPPVDQAPTPVDAPVSDKPLEPKDARDSVVKFKDINKDWYKKLIDTHGHKFKNDAIKESLNLILQQRPDLNHNYVMATLDHIANKARNSEEFEREVEKTIRTVGQRPDVKLKNPKSTRPERDSRGHAQDAFETKFAGDSAWRTEELSKFISRLRSVDAEGPHALWKKAKNDPVLLGGGREGTAARQQYFDDLSKRVEDGLAVPPLNDIGKKKRHHESLRYVDTLPINERVKYWKTALQNQSSDTWIPKPLRHKMAEMTIDERVDYLKSLMRLVAG